MKKLELKASLTILATALILTACGGNGSSSEGRLGSNDNAASDTGSTDQIDNNSNTGSGDNTNGGAGGAPSTSEQVCSGDIDFAITGVVPEDGATGVDVGSSARVTFNANIDEGSIAGAVSLSSATVSPVDASISVNGNALLINPTSSLDPNTQYTINIEDSVAADCEETVQLPTRATSTFTTDGNAANNGDNEAPEIVISTPDLMGLLPVDLSLVIDFTEPLDSSTVSLDTIFITPVGSDEKIAGEFSFDGSRIIFTPSQPLPGNSSFELNIPGLSGGPNSGLTDLSGNPLAALLEPISFITSGITAILDGLPGGNPLGDLQSALEDLAGNLISQLPGDSGGEAPNQQAIFEIPITLGALIAAGAEELTTLLGLPANDAFDPSSLTDLISPDSLANLLDGSILTQLQGLFASLPVNPSDTAIANALIGGDYDLVVLEIFPLLVNGELTPEKLAEFSSVVIAVCDPKGNATGTDTACTLSVNIGFGSFSEAVQQEFADALTGGDPAALGQAILNVGSLVFSNDGGLLSVDVLDDSGLPLPEALETPIVGLLDQIGQIPVLGSLTNQQDVTRLVNANVLNTSVATVQAGQLLNLVVIPTDLIDAGILTDPNATASLLEANGALLEGLSEAGLEPVFNGLCTIRLLCTD